MYENLPKIDIRKSLEPSESDALFAALFTKYRQKSTLRSLGDFGNALAEQGLALDNSTFSHWQCGTRIPKVRKVIILVLKVLFAHQGITSLVEANSLLEASGQGHLTPEEENLIFAINKQRAKTVQGPIYLTSMHLMMPTKLVMKLEAMAAQHGISKASLISHLLEEKLEAST